MEVEVVPGRQQVLNLAFEQVQEVVLAWEVLLVVVLDLVWGLLQEHKHLLVHRPEASLPIQNNTYALSYLLSHTKLAGWVYFTPFTSIQQFVRTCASTE